MAAQSLRRGLADASIVLRYDPPPGRKEEEGKPTQLRVAFNTIVVFACNSLTLFTWYINNRHKEFIGEKKALDKNRKVTFDIIYTYPNTYEHKKCCQQMH